jgi:hypothetical protein
MKIKIDENAESPVVLVVKAEGSDTIEDLNVYGCWNHLKPNH